MSVDKNDNFEAIAYKLPAHYKGKRLKLSAFIKTEKVTGEGFALWLRLDPRLGLNNMNGNWVKGTQDWKKYEIELPNIPEAEYIAFGAFLSGNGKAWVDHFELTLDGKQLSQAEVREIVKIDSSEFNELRRDLDFLKQSLHTAQIDKKETNRNFVYIIVLIALLSALGIYSFLKTKKTNNLRFQELMLSQRNKTKTSKLSETSTIETLSIATETKSKILSALKEFEEKEYFLSKESTIEFVSKRLNTNRTYLSKVIQSEYGCNFNHYINFLKIDYAIARLKNDVIFRRYSIKAISEELGYKSADSFNKNFRKKTGLSASLYIKQLNKMDET